MRKNRRLLWLLAIGIGSTIGIVQGRTEDQPGVATPWTEVHGARLRLLASADPAQRGKSILAGLEIELADGWKTYWRTPGESGVPPNFDWMDSLNTASIKVLYPAPTRMFEAGAETIGYKKPVVFPIRVVPKNPSEAIELKLALDFAVCREICVPAQAVIDLIVPPAVLAGSPTPAMVAALGHVPRAQSARQGSDPQLGQVTAKLDSPPRKLMIEGNFPGASAAADLFIEAPDGIFVPMAHKLPVGRDGAVRFSVDLSKGDTARELRGKQLTLTLVGELGASEAGWKLE
jgi:DsbC/DsbD-like thiol-disulfide interchange protein